MLLNTIFHQILLIFTATTTKLRELLNFTRAKTVFLLINIMKILDKEDFILQKEKVH